MEKVVSTETVLKFVRDVNLLLLIPHGRAGSFFLQSLLDGHEQIIMFPSYFTRYGWGVRGGAEAFNAIDDFCANNGSFFDSDKSYFADSGWTTLSPDSGDKGQRFCLDVIRFKKTWKRLFKELVPDLQADDRLFFTTLHLALALELGRDLTRIKYICLHLHGYGKDYTPYFRSLLRDFPDLRFVAALRDLREGWVSYRQLMKKRWGEQNFFNFSLRNFSLNLRYYYQLLECYHLLRREQICFVDLNRLHVMQSEAMKALARWLGIEYSDDMTKSTFWDIPWWGNAADGKALNGFSFEKSKYKWPNEISPEEIGFLDYFSAPIQKVFGYEIKSKPPSWYAVYKKLFFSPPVLNYPRQDSIFLKIMQTNRGFSTDGRFRYWPLLKNGKMGHIIGWLSFVAVSLATFLKRYFTSDWMYFEQKRKKHLDRPIVIRPRDFITPLAVDNK